jgi:hypothetical protein
VKSGAGQVTSTAQRLRVTVLLLLALLACAPVDCCPELPRRRIVQLAGPWTWSAVDWESRYLPSGIGEIVERALKPPPAESVRGTVRAYLVGELAEGDFPKLPLAFASVVEGELLRRGVASLGPLAFPPVSVVATPSPRVLVVSPRSEIRLAYWILLPGEMELEVIEELERSVERHDLSALVVRTGGISTFPVLAPIDADPQFTLQTVAHEWTHTALFFTPLGLTYGSSPEARAINETTADIVGKEVAEAVMRELGVPTRPEGDPEGPGNELMRELRRIRQAADARLASGDIVGAEAYLEDERRALDARGYRIRRLNQAFFAFHGNYAEGPAASPEVPDSLALLRSRSPTLGAFVQRVGSITSLEELRAAVR